MSKNHIVEDKNAKVKAASHREPPMFRPLS